MPIYEYRCTRCGHIAEEWVKSFNSPMTEPCPECGAEAVRIVSDTSFQLKGSGWYVTEYKKSGVSQSHDPATEASSSAAANSESSADSAATETSKTESSKTESAKTESGKAESGKTESGKAAASSSSAATESKTASAAA